MKERDVNFFRPVWRRIAVVAVCLIWAALEFWHGEQMWIFITLGLTGYAVWSFFITYPKQLPAPAVTAATTPAETQEGSDVPPQA